MVMFKGFRATAHLSEQLGDERFAALISSDNTGKVKKFCDELIANGITTTITIGDRTYDLLGFLKGDEESVKGDVMVKRAKKMGANSGQDDGQYLLDHQAEIPEALRGKVAFIFTDWRRPGDSRHVAFVGWRGGCWSRHWDWLGDDWHGFGRLLRRK